MIALTLKGWIQKVIGSIQPIGSSEVDEKRFDNLKEMCELTEELINEINTVYIRNHGDPAYSVKRSSDYAKQFMNKIRKEL